MEKNFDWRKYLVECLSSTYFCALATREKDGVWVCPVYFAYDENFNLYFISRLTSRHMENIKEDVRAAVAIYSTNQSSDGDVKGAYLEGTAKILSDTEVPQAHKVYYGREKNYYREPSEHVGEKAEWKFVKVTPSRMYYFDTRFFDENRVEVPKKVFSNK